MNRMMYCLPLFALTICTIASAEPRAGLFRTASLPVVEETSAPISLVGFFHGYRGVGGYGPSCGCDLAAPSCGIEPSCGADPSCGFDACAPRCRHRHFGHIFHRHGRGCNVIDSSCGCDAAPDCGCDAAHACGGGRHCHFGHRLCGHCGHGCGCRCVGHPHRFWANGWCGQTVDGYHGGNPVDCSGGPVDMKSAPVPEASPEEAPMDVPAKSTRRLPLSPRFSAKPIGSGLQ